MCARLDASDDSTLHSVSRVFSVFPKLGIPPELTSASFNSKLREQLRLYTPNYTNTMSLNGSQVDTGVGSQENYD
jgi:hypothetical protein